MCSYTVTRWPFTTSRFRFEISRNFSKFFEIMPIIKMHNLDNGGLLGEFEGHKVTEYRPEVHMTLKNVLATSEDGNIFIWNLLSQQLKNKIEVKHARSTTGDDVMPVSSFDLFDDGIVAAAGSKLFLRSAPGL